MTFHGQYLRIIKINVTHRDIHVYDTCRTY